MKFLFLYTELADYFLNCCKDLSQHGEVHIIRWPVNKEAPFKFEFGDKIRIYNKADHSLSELKALIGSINPSVIICSGWIDKDYLKLVKGWFGSVPTVMTCDTRWTGSVRQVTATVLSRLFLKRIFSHIWVPGTLQKQYALRLGFKKENILMDFYVCDLPRFNRIHQRRSQKKDIPHKFIYIGRYYDFKGVTEMWEAFSQLCREEEHDWELWCLGNGDIHPAQHPRIKHLGFVQPAELEPILDQCGVFILPSRFEPWAVVVQECAAAGFPLLLSKAVGAGEYFLEEDKNGFSFDKENVLQLKQAMKRILSLSQDRLKAMGEHSHALAQKVSPANWSNTLIELVHAQRK